MDVERLRAIPVFASLDHETLHAVAVFAGESSVPDGSQIVSEGDYAHQFMAIEEGTADVIRGDEKIATLGPGDFFGEIGVMQNEMRAATVVAKTPMRLITLTHWELKRMRDMPGVMEAIQRTAEARR